MDGGRSKFPSALNPDVLAEQKQNQRLRAAVATHGSSWKDIQTTHFPTRSANNVKNQ